MAGAVQSTVEGFDPTTRTFRVIASTRAPVRGFEPAVAGRPPVERVEVLESWDLSRYLQNPVVLKDHDTENISAILGFASGVRETERGLEMLITLGSSAANPEIEQIAAKLAEGLLRGVSVGFEFGERTDELRDGRTVAVFRRNVLNEVSLVTVPADPGALVTDAGQRLPSWQDFAHAVYVLREIALETDDPEDVRQWHEAQDDYSSRFANAPRLPGQGAPRVAFDAAKKTRTTCDCPRVGECVCTFNPHSEKEIKTDMAHRSADYEQGVRDARDAHGDQSAIKAERQRELAQQRRTSTPLAKLLPGVAQSSQTALDAWDLEQLKDRPNTSTVTPSGGTAQPASGAEERWQRDFAGMVPGGLSKRGARRFGDDDDLASGRDRDKLDGKDELTIETERERRRAANPPWMRPLMVSKGDGGPEAA